ncbi:MAG: VanZ family protein [Eubacteriales bacterium]
MRIKRLTVRQVCSIIALILWMGFIFFMSAQDGEDSTKTSNKAIEVIQEVTEKLFPSSPTQPSLIHKYVRTLGHFTEYFVLGVIAAFTLHSYKVKPPYSLFLSVGFCMLYALSDEIHQLFVAGRACELSDWLVDMAGAGLGILLYKLASYLKKKIIPSKRTYI